ncbi:MAG TPA: zinc transporter ZupT [Synergistaceae bacterium]|jgi:ZIP family zinc transporter|nr:zinc transporter ZupT [Synergistaceae bacterium]
MDTNVLIAFGLTLLAGLSTGIGSILAFFAKRTNTRFLSFALGFSAGVMVYVSMADILPHAQKILQAAHGEQRGSWISILSFFAGIFVVLLIDRLVPYYENPHELHCVEEAYETEVETGHRSALMRLGLLSAIAVTVHNFPEGIAAFMASVHDPRLGLPIALAIAIHNIPEGIAISVPIYCATGDRFKAFRFSFFSGLAEPLGALLAYLVLMPFLNDTVFGVTFAAVAGIMIFISVDQLLPSAQKYGEHHISAYGFIAGMMVMAVSLLLFIQ